MVLMEGVASRWADTKATGLIGFKFSRHIGVTKAGEAQCLCTIKRSFVGITITGCCYKFETRPTTSFNPDDSIALSYFSLLSFFMVLLHLA